MGGFCGGVPEWPKGTDCKSVVYDFGGSNPPPPTTNWYQHRLGPERFGAGIAQLVEHQPSKLRVASSNLVSRSTGNAASDEDVQSGAKHNMGAHVAQSVEHLHGKQAVSSSNLLVGSIQ